MSDLSAYGPLIALIVLICASVWLGTLAQRAVQSGSFIKGYFLGNRGLGAWTLALTATVQSGGTFMGFPSLVYSHGWAVALWICGYMVVPLTGFGVLGKRMAQLSRRTGAITVPDLFRERFGNAKVGAVALAFILVFMSFMMVAQFKAGALIMKIAWPNSGVLALSEDAESYRISTEALSGLAKAGLPDALSIRLRPLVDEDFASEKLFRERLASLLTPDEIKTHGSKVIAAAAPFDWLYLLGLVIFAITVVGYTLIGGFLAAVWTDLFQSVMMFVGVVALLCLTLQAAGSLLEPAKTIEQATLTAVANTDPSYAFGPGFARDGRQFLPLGLAVSFFFVWVFSGVGSPAGVVRIMACKDTATIRRSIFLLSVYNLCIYVPLVVICICGRSLIPDLARTDEIIPRLALNTTSKIWGGPFIAGIILAAPFGAVMATVSSYLVVIASGIVRDLFQKFIRPEATQVEIRRLTYAAMTLVGIVAFVANIWPVAYLQAIVVFSGTSAATTFVVPALMTAYWRRATAAGTIAAMLSGGGTSIGLYLLGFALPDPRIGQATSFRPFFLLGFEPLLWGLAVSLVAGIVVSLATKPPPQELLSRLFDAQEPTS